MNVIIYTNEVGKITNRAALAEKFKKLKPNSSYKVAIRDVRKTTDKQRGYYFAGVCKLVMEGFQELGWEEIDTPYKAHKELEKMFCVKCIVNKHTGELMELPGDIMDYEPAEFNLYLEKIYQFAAQELNTVIPPPNTQTEIEYKES